MQKRSAGMSEKYQPKVGDRVRVVLEGEVTVTRSPEDGERRFVVGSGIAANWVYPDAEHTVSVEKVTPPLPTTPGSVIRNCATIRMLDRDGMWRGPNNGSGLTTEDAVEYGYEVVFDAGAAK